MTRLVVTRDAEKDLATILTFLKEEANAIVAEEFGRDLRRTLLRLVQFPESGALRPELGPDVRLTPSSRKLATAAKQPGMNAAPLTRRTALRLRAIRRPTTSSSIAVSSGW